MSMSGKLDPSTFLYDVPPLLLETFCKVMDSGPDTLGWRALAARILPSWLEVRCSEMLASTGKSPSNELLWSWAQQNKTVADLIRVLEDMGHYRALNLFCSYESSRNAPNPSSSFICSKPQTSSEDASLIPQSDSVLDQGSVQKNLITYSDVIEGTRNFHHDLKIGDSSFAEIFQGRWGNKIFAVKVFKQVNKKSWKTLWEKFKTEIEVLQLNKHSNILELWGSFSEGERYCLVYPFLPNGSLYHRLHSEQVERALSWQDRFEIIKGTAKAVYHLHTTQPCMVICGNITSSNILLDEHLQPKLSDFGMARLRPHSVNQSCTITINTSSCSNLAYLPEEYIRDGKLSVKLDIYSFGTVILETCTAQKVMQEEPKHTLLRDVLKLEAEEKGCVDACLRFLDCRAGCWPTAEAICLLRLGLECTSSRARARPSIEAVLQKLSECLPLPFPPVDQPQTLDDMALPQLVHDSKGINPSLPTEDEETEEPEPPNQPEHHECTNSEGTSLSTEKRRICQSSSSVIDSGVEPAAAGCLQTYCEPVVDLYSSWPVECSCVSGAEMGCEDCWVNGFTDNPSFTRQGDRSQSFLNAVDNPAKRRLKHKIHLYNQGLIKTEELLSMTSE